MVFVLVFTWLLAFVFGLAALANKSWIALPIALVLTFFGLCGLFSFSVGDQWTLDVRNGILHWSYDRFPKSSGRIDLRGVNRIIVNDCSARISLIGTDGSTTKIRLTGHGFPLYKYLQANFPEIRVDFIEGT
jgi:hypothetical protein